MESGLKLGKDGRFPHIAHISTCPMTEMVAALVGTLLLWAALGRLRRDRVKVITVIDGDTVMAVNRAGARHKVRVYGIDAPELSQRGGQAAKARLSELVLGQWVTVRWRGKDKHRRRLAWVYAGKANVSVVLVREGLAFAMPGSGLAWFAVLPRLRWRGVHKPWQPTPGASLTRRIPLLGWLASHRAKRARAATSRSRRA